MSRFQPALESYIEGQSDLPTLQSELKSDLMREPLRASELGTLIQNQYRAGKINGPTYLELMEVVRSTVPPVSPPSAPVGGDRTLYRPGGTTPPSADEATRLRTFDQAVSEVEATKLSPASQPRTDAPSGTGNSGGWGDLRATGGESRPLRPGDTVKERFVLVDEIGRGGMGVVFRARDLRKEEAQDRNPFVALKVLGEDFKRHPESLKALQREARKAQNLAHPNIVTVFDFDRDGPNVYIVMELLEGEPLDRYIRSVGSSGLSIARALPIIRGLCGALAYAHEHQVVHSDFKPANAFITKTGAIKVFDFGIARAAKRTGALEETASNKTLFDPGTLGALTPAYASCEMIEGDEPDPRDDIYALGCVVYELLTGRHPFERKTAVQARDQKMKLKPIRGLTGRQWRALRRALAFDRAMRMPSVTKFLEEISPVKRSPALWIGLGAAALLVAGVTAVLLPNYLQQRRVAALGAQIRSGDPAAIEQALPGIEELSESVRVTLLLDESIRAPTLDYFNARIADATDASRQRYDYPQAERLLGELQRLFPDSQAVARIGEALETRKNDEIKRQSDRFDEYLERGWLVPAQNADDSANSISGVLAIVRQIDLQHPLLVDPRLPSAYAEQAQLAMQRSQIDLAASLVQAGLAIASNDRTLQDLNDTIAREQLRQQRAIRLADLRLKLVDELPNATDLAQIDAVHEDLSLLDTLDPQDTNLRRVQQRLQTLLDRELDTLQASQSLDEAHALLARYADLAAPGYVEKRRAALADAYNRSSAPTATRDAAVAGLKRELDALLADPEADDAWDARVRAQLSKLAAYLPTSDEYMAAATQRAAESHVAAAAALRSQGRLSEAERALQMAQSHAPELDAITRETQQLNRMRVEQETRDREQKRLAELAAMKQKLQDQATANEVREAEATLRELRARLPANDPFLVSAPATIAAAYVRLAGVDARDSRFDSAISRLDRALQLDPSNAQATTLRQEYTQQLASVPAATPAPVVPPSSPAPESPKPATSQPAASTLAPTPTTSVAIATPPATAPSTQNGGVACTASLAGYGSRSRGVCFDAFSGGRGPDLVVVPAAAGAKPFAISRFEISTGDFATFCKLSGQCTAPAGQADLPMTSIAMTEVQQYIAWLSNTTGHVYRLPTDEEWTHVANAPGGSAERDYNCVVELNGRKVRGFSLDNVRAGRPNGWGLYNLAGNAQEWVRSGEGWVARGGAFSDPISGCGPTASRVVGGAADPSTGFRVVREL
jgi:non-specific serine/threonine protein kinase